MKRSSQSDVNGQSAWPGFAVVALLCCAGVWSVLTRGGSSCSGTPPPAEKGTGSGEPGYTIKDEIWEGAKHDRAGLLCMANRGPNTNGAQFFITDAATPHLDGGYTIFGECEPLEVVHAIASVPKGATDRPESPVTIKSVRISRRP